MADGLTAQESRGDEIFLRVPPALPAALDVLSELPLEDGDLQAELDLPEPEEPLDGDDGEAAEGEGGPDDRA